MELITRKKSAVTKRPIGKLSFPNGAIIGGIVRGDKSYIATAEMQIEEDDKVVVFALPNAINRVEKLFS